MSQPQPLHGIDVVVLAGGLGTRIAGILGDIPKILAPVGERAFLDHLLDNLAALGAQRVVLSLGHLAERVIDHLKRSSPPLTVEWCVETEQLGTAGGLALARPLLKTDPVMVMNGDTWLVTDYDRFVAHFHTLSAAASLLCVAVDDVGRYGAVKVDHDHRVISFTEKGGKGPGWINGGVVLLSQAVLARVPARGSLENDVLKHLGPSALTGFTAADATFIDIGTPDTLAAAESVITLT